MEKKIIFENVSYIKKIDGIYNKTISDFSFEFNNNSITSLITDDVNLFPSIDELIRKKTDPSYGDISFEGDYFDKDLNLNKNTLFSISEKKVERLSLSHSLAKDYISRDIPDNKKLEKKYSKKISILEKEILKINNDSKFILDEYDYRLFIENKNIVKKLEEYFINYKYINNYFNNKNNVNEINLEIKKISKLINEEKNNTLKVIKSNNLEFEGKHSIIINSYKGIINMFWSLYSDEKEEYINIENISKIKEDQSILIFNKLKKEVKSIIRFIKKIRNPGFDLSKSTKQLFSKIENSKNEETFYKSLDSLLELLNEIHSFTNGEIKDEIYNRIDFIEEAKNYKSPVNTKNFNKAYNFIFTKWKNELKNNINIINDIEKRVGKCLRNDKQETSSSKRKLWEFEIISLKYLKQIFKEKNYILKNSIKEIKSSYFKHRENNMKDFYSLVEYYEKLFTTIEISLNNWKLKRNIKYIKLELDINLQYLENRRKVLNNKLDENSKNIVTSKFYLLLKDENLLMITNNFSLKLKDLSNIHLHISNFRKKYLINYKKEIKNIENKIDFYNKKINDIKSTEKELFITYLFEDMQLSSDLLNSKLNTLSKTQIQRIILSKALLLGSEIIIFENPINDVGPESQTSISSAIRLISKLSDIIIICLTPDLKIASTFSSHISIFSENKNIERGTTEDIIENPKHEWTKQIVKEIDRSRLNTIEMDPKHIFKKSFKHNEYTDLSMKNISKTHIVYSTKEEIESWGEK